MIALLRPNGYQRADGLFACELPKQGDEEQKKVLIYSIRTSGIVVINRIVINGVHGRQNADLNASRTASDSYCAAIAAVR